MAKKEASFDLYIHDLLKNAGISADTQGSGVVEIDNALKTASKHQTGNIGFPEYVAVVRDFVLVMEDKADRANLCLKENGEISMSVYATTQYAVNGALFYARKILDSTSYEKVFAFGNAGDEKHHDLQPLFVGKNGYKELEKVETFENFSEINIEDYYRRVVLGEPDPEAVTLTDILKKAKDLHEHLRNYGNLGEAEKPLIVSAILLALREKENGFSLSQLTADNVKTDGEKLYEQVENNLKRAKVSPEVKLERVLHQFTMMRDRPLLNTVRPDLKKTPLKFFAEYIDQNIFNAIVSNTPEDYLGRFYSEFVSYSGGDGQSLGVVLTPRHITELFCDLVDLKPDDVLFDPCCGTGGFLVSGMHRMIDAAKGDKEKIKNIKEKQIHGIEIRDDMFSIATTNMILRGDGQSNLVCDDFFRKAPEEIKGKGVTVGFMNPPYSQAKGKETAHLSELRFIRHLLDCVTDGGRAAVIVPLSVMIGKTKEDKLIKADIMKNHTLEGVISLNKSTFYPVGTNPCIAVFTTGRPHPAKKLVKFINFEDDGFEVKKHLGLVETERAKDRRQYMLDCWRGYHRDTPSNFMIETAVEAEDEWLHSFYYFNDEIPTEQDFMNSIADYLTFEFNMIAHGRGYLFEEEGGGDVEAEPDKVAPLKEKEWKDFYIRDIFQGIGRGKRLKTADHISGAIPYVSASAINNGVDDFIGNQEGVRRFSDCLSIANSGSVGRAFYHCCDFIASDHVTALKSPKLNRYSYLFISTIVSRLQDKYSFNREINDTRIRKERIILPVGANGEPDWAYMEQYVKQKTHALLRRYLQKKLGEF